MGENQNKNPIHLSVQNFDNGRRLMVCGKKMYAKKSLCDSKTN